MTARSACSNLRFPNWRGSAAATPSAQLWEDTLIVAYMRAGHGDKAARRISARLDRRPSARDEAWSRQAQRN